MADSPYQRQRIRDEVLEHQWFAVAQSTDITDTPRRVTVLGEDVVLWRSGDDLHAFRDLCIHRGAALSLGTVQNGCIVCPYHGWRYDSTGHCVAIPAQPPDMDIPTKAKTDAYACRERYGLVWVSLGTPQTDVPTFAEGDDPDFYTLACGPYELNAEAPRVIENFLDVSHLMWVHEGLLGDTGHAEIAEYHVHQQNGQLVSDTIPIYQPDPDGRGRVVTNNYVYEVLTPMAARFRKTDPDTSEVFSMLMLTTPVRRQQTLAYALLSRNYDFDTPDQVFQDFQNKLLEQDRAVVESQRPEALPLDLQAELHLKSDRMAISYRRYLAEMGVKVGVA